MEWLVLWFACGIGAGMIGAEKRAGGCGWAIAGFLLGPIGLLIAIGMPKNDEAIERRAAERGERRACPQCAELVRPAAVVCRFCGANLKVFYEP